MNVEFQAHRLQKAHANLVAAKNDSDEMAADAAKNEIALREKMLNGAGFKVFADEHDVMLLQAA